MIIEWGYLFSKHYLDRMFVSLFNGLTEEQTPLPHIQIFNIKKKHLVKLLVNSFDQAKKRKIKYYFYYFFNRGFIGPYI